MGWKANDVSNYDALRGLSVHQCDLSRHQAGCPEQLWSPSTRGIWLIMARLRIDFKAGYEDTGWGLVRQRLESRGIKLAGKRVTHLGDVVDLAVQQPMDHGKRQAKLQATGDRAQPWK